MSARKTNDEFINELKNKYGDEYTPIDEYVTAHTKIKIKHNLCGEYFYVEPIYLLNKYKCPVCNKNRIKSNSNCVKTFKVKNDDDFKRAIIQLESGKYTSETKYIKNKEKIILKHHDCGNIYETTPYNFFRGRRCPYCYINKRKTNDEFINELKNKYGDEYELLDEYVNAHTKIKIKHNLCGNIYYNTPNKILQYRKCPYCFGHIKLTKDIVQNRLNEKYGQERFLILGDYINNKTKTLFKCNICDSTFKTTPAHILNDTSCPICSESKGERKISMFFNKHNIKYIREYSFNDCVNIKKLRFDFFIPDKNILIEYNGIQHYKDIEIFGSLEDLQNRDFIKIKYAKDNGIKLIIIKYSDYNNIEEILEREIIDEVSKTQIR